MINTPGDFLPLFFTAGCKLRPPSIGVYPGPWYVNNYHFIHIVVIDSLSAPLLHAVTCLKILPSNGFVNFETIFCISDSHCHSVLLSLFSYFR